MNNLLRKADTVINGARQSQYGNPIDNHRRIAAIWEVITGREYTPQEVAAMMIGVKLARLANKMGHEDTWMDIAGYAALGWEMSDDKTSVRNST